MGIAIVFVFFFLCMFARIDCQSISKESKYSLFGVCSMEATIHGVMMCLTAMEIADVGPRRRPSVCVMSSKALT